MVFFAESFFSKFLGSKFSKAINKLSFENKMKAKRQNIKMARKSSQSVSKYYQKAANAHTGESIFLDKKK